MSRRSWTALLLLASLWGASYLFVAIGLDDLSPSMIVLSRTLLAGLVLLPLALRRGALRGMRGVLGPIAILAAVQVAGPFLLISAGQRDIPSSLAGILVASAPIFTALLAVWVDHDERSSGWRLGGVGIGIVGVGLLLGVDTAGDSAALIGGVLVLVASLGYAIGSLYLKRRLGGIAPLGIVAATMLASAAMVAPLALATAPPALPGLDTVGAMLALGIAGTGIAFVIFYTLIASVGPARASIVAYIAPVFAVFYGVTLLGESVGPATFAGLALILGGSWLAAGGYERTPAAVPAPVPALVRD
ncbi:MAG TPA: DMT family transporter [Thermoleophilaceae bacterium]|nr:DMT family transporter [Thermoleophilaceae bacterium]